MVPLSTSTTRTEARPRERAGGRALNQALQIGDWFLDYHIEGVLDEGGMGIVYEATELASDDVVAIKCILPCHANRADFLKRFNEECKVYPKLKHDNIVKMRRAGVAPGSVPFIVMDRLEGRTVRQLLTRFGRLIVLNALHVMVQVADAMRFAHEKGVLHRDLKPENIMVGTKDDRKGHVWLLDFGIAKVEGGGLNTDELPAIGTVRYLSSEHARDILQPAKNGKRFQPDGRADIYAFGVILYEVLTGKHPFIGDGERASFEEMLAGLLTAEPVPVHELVPDCPLGLWELVAKCIAKDPDARYATFGQVALAIRALLHTLGPTIPANHPEARRRKEEEARSARQAAFEAMQLEEAEHGEAAPVEAARKAAQSVTAELRDFVPTERALPFGHGPAVGLEATNPPLAPQAVTAELLDFDSSESPLPFLQEPMSAPPMTPLDTTSVLPPAEQPMKATHEAGAPMAVMPASAPTPGKQKAPSSMITVTVSLSTTQMLVLLSCLGLVFALGGAALLLLLRAGPMRLSEDAMPAAATSISASPPSAPSTPSTPSAPTTQEAPSASSTVRAPTPSMPTAEPTTSPAPSLSKAAAPPAASVSKPKRPVSTGPKPAATNPRIFPLFDDFLSEPPKGRR